MQQLPVIVHHHKLADAEQLLVETFRVDEDGEQSPEVTEACQAKIDGGRSLTRLVIKAVLMKPTRTLGDQLYLRDGWELTEQVLNRLDVFRQQIRPLLGHNYLLGDIFMHNDSLAEHGPTVLSFTIYKATSGPNSNIQVHANTRSEGIAMSKGEPMKQCLADDQIVVTPDTFMAVLATLT